MYQICLGKKGMIFTGDIETEGGEGISLYAKFVRINILLHIISWQYYRAYSKNCIPANRPIVTLADCARLTNLQILMGRDGTYKGVYREKVLGDFMNIEKTENLQKYFRLDWKTGEARRFS